MKSRGERRAQDDSLADAASTTNMDGGGMYTCRRGSTLGSIGYGLGTSSLPLQCLCQALQQNTYRTARELATLSAIRNSCGREEHRGALVLNWRAMSVHPVTRVKKVEKYRNSSLFGSTA